MNGYGKVYHLGTRDVATILDGKVYVEEKVDGSQFSFGCDVAGDFWCASRSKALSVDTEDQLFAGAIRTAWDLYECGWLEPGMVVRGEAVRGPRHNKLRYARVPKGNLALFDVSGGDYGELTREALEDFASKAQLECVPVIALGRFTVKQLEDLVAGESFLGGCQREGIVIKQACGGPDRMKAKLVSESFKERKAAKPRGAVGVESVVDQYRTEARWDKAIQHLQEAGELEGRPEDIPKIMRELHRDLLDECGEEIREALWPKIWKEIVRGVSKGAPEHYLGKLRGEQ